MFKILIILTITNMYHPNYSVSVDALYFKYKPMSHEECQQTIPIVKEALMPWLGGPRTFTRTITAVCVPYK